MAAQMCPNCGGSNPAGAAFCQYCGSAFATGAATPLPSNAPPPAPPFPGSTNSWAGAPPQYAAPRRRSRLLVVLAVIVAVILVLGVVSFLLVPPGPEIQVTIINVDSPDNVCGLDGEYGDGFNASTGDLVGFDYLISGANASSGGTLPCTIVAVSTPTAGFSVTNVSVPLTVPANETVDLTFSIQCPGSDYTGSLTLVMT
ncbi:MAG: zinc ribbon domain-containing protein [Thermoplasmata archaeon]|nr:zinc ribbon domain-containing protein [Thermoplasmata archaeon]